MATVLAALLGPALVALGGAPAQAVADKDCPDFGSQRAAQIFFLKHGGPASDPHRLDADSDGIACEENPDPHYYGTTLPGASSEPSPPAVVHSKARLAASRRAGIAGERVALRVTVAPRMRRQVVLQRKAGRGWTRVAAGRTSRHGTLVIKTRTRGSTTRYRALVPQRKAAHKRYTATTSGSRRVVTLRQRVLLRMPRATAAGDPVRAVVAASPVRSGRRVVLERRVAGGWRVVGRGRESGAGRTALRVAAPAVGRFAYRAVVLRWHGATPAASAQRRLHVRDLTPPPVPQRLAGDPGDGQVRLTWAPVRAPDLARYVVYRSTTGGAPWTVVDRPLVASALVSGLGNGTRYFFAVSAVDIHGNESLQSTRLAVTPQPPADTTPPAVPTGLRAEAGDQQVDLAWDPVQGADLAGYLVRMSDGGPWGPAVDGLVTGESAQVTGLTNGTAYEFAVVAVDHAGNKSEASGTVTATPTAPPAP